MTKAIVMISGGLDSMLAVKAIKENGIQVIGVHFVTPFNKGCCANLTDIMKFADDENIKLKVVTSGIDYLEMIRKPKHGYGSAMNPCIDCRIYMFRIAKRIMEEEGADFIVTGEVLGQRPMSQNLVALNLIEKEAGLEGQILRPLSAKELKPTLAESEGKITRERLGDIKGRSRKQQIDMAKKFGLSAWPNAGGGCILTDSNYAAKLGDAFEHFTVMQLKDIKLLSLGRHFRLSKSVKLVVGRNKEENEQIRSMREDHVLLEPDNFMGPTGLLIGEPDNELLSLACSIIAGYGDPADYPMVTITSNREVVKMKTSSIDRGVAAAYLITAQKPHH
ncbi:MAG: hypothetical protein JRN22_04125 [Nitrososphaerota archaeon]|nr:hypothetical protein [Nitrososphaerota archaeon]